MKSHVHTLRILAHVQTNIAYRKQNVARSQTDADQTTNVRKNCANLDFSYNDRYHISYA